MHHIVPKHHYKKHKLNKATLDLPENLVPVNYADHIKAHQLRYEVYGERGDKIAVMFLTKNKEEALKQRQILGGEASNKIFREKKMFMHSNAFQKEMAARSMAKDNALETRSAAGKKGAERHRNTILRSGDRYLWSLSKEEFIRLFGFDQANPVGNTREFMCTFGFQQAGDLCSLLNEIRPCKNLKSIAPLLGTRAVTPNWRRSSYGWSADPIATFHEEAAAGIRANLKD